MSVGAQLKCSCYSCRYCVEFGEDSDIFWQWSVCEDLLGEGDILGVVFHICMDSFSEKYISQICKKHISNCNSLTPTRCGGSRIIVNDRR